MPLIPAMLYVCARWMRSPILAVDLVRWITDGSLPYMASLEVRQHTPFWCVTK